MKKLKKNQFCDFRSKKIVIFHWSWLISEKPVTCKDSKKNDSTTLNLGCLLIKSRIFVTIA